MHIHAASKRASISVGTDTADGIAFDSANGSHFNSSSGTGRTGHNSGNASSSASSSQEHQFKERHSYVISTQESINTNFGIIRSVKAEGVWPNFLFSLRRLMQPYNKNQTEYKYNCFSQFSRYIFLSGSVSLIRELRHMQVLDTQGVSGVKIKAFAAKIEQALFQWRTYFHLHIHFTNTVWVCLVYIVI
ncbi:unnamed protein product [Ambrosiozyma monospora]|uniref:Unnamed protein product n=1 Tax=Ambrosiozyma monospora TaxID=43982 RepID=A0ACB5UAT5_AMBMO|nr:unnamed protein product [Ambrosiozyma monospora]